MSCFFLFFILVSTCDLELSECLLCLVILRFAMHMAQTSCLFNMSNASLVTVIKVLFYSSEEKENQIPKTLLSLSI